MASGYAMAGRTRRPAPLSPSLTSELTIQIGELARRTAMTVDAIRFYERRGLLPRAPRTTGRFRLYTAREIERLHFIRQMQALGFSLAEIKELLDLRSHNVDACPSVRRLLQSKLADTRAKAMHLRKLERELLADLKKCNSEIARRRRRNPSACPVLVEGSS
jgi:MerR family transcriptional regulator, mercuric resistance operon regulatory protein